MIGTCSVDGCDRPIYGCQDVCSKHYQARRKENKQGYYGKICSVTGCNNPVASHGMCNHHFYASTHNVSRDTSTGYRRIYPSEYHAWVSMKSRCYNENNPKYRIYGGKGITVSDRWIEKPYGFKNFIDDMGPKPGDGYSIDRIDPNLGYSKDNCRWANWAIQGANVKKKRSHGVKRVGVCYVQQRGGTKPYWYAYICVNGKSYSKIAHSEEEAIEIRKSMEMEYLGYTLDGIV